MRVATAAKSGGQAQLLAPGAAHDALRSRGAPASRWAGAPVRRRPPPAGGAAAACRRLVQAAAGGQPGGPMADELQQPTLVLAGFYIEEVAAVRQLLDSVGGEAVKVVPTTPDLLHAPVAQALRQPEPQWRDPVPASWTHGGGWGQQRMVLVSGLDPEGAYILVNLMGEANMPGVCPAFANPANLGAPLGEVLAAALSEHRRSGRAAAGGARSSGSGGSSGAAAEGADHLPMEFVDELPPAEEVVRQGLKQQRRPRQDAAAAAPAASPAADGAEDGDGSGRRARQAASSPPPDVVQAEFSERPAAAAPAAQAAAPPPVDVTLDAIDAIATGSAPAAEPLDGATASASAGAAAAGDQEAPMDSEELLQAARAAMGLDQAELQEMVDRVAQRAAEAAGVPFIGGAEAGAGAQQAGAAAGAAGAPAWVPNPRARPASGGGTRRPWEAAQAAGEGSASGGAAKGSSPAAADAPQKGFGASAAAPSRKAAKAAAKTVGKRSSQEVLSGGSTLGKDAAAAPARKPSPEQKGQPAAAQEGAADGAGEEGAVLPPPDMFVLSKAQLKAVTEKHGLNFEEVLRGIQERGIPLAD